MVKTPHTNPIPISEPVTSYIVTMSSLLTSDVGMHRWLYYEAVGLTFGLFRRVGLMRVLELLGLLSGCWLALC